MKKIFAGIIITLLVPTVCMAGLWTSYDESMINQFQPDSKKVLDAKLEDIPKMLDALYDINKRLGIHCEEITVTNDKRRCFIDYKYTADTLSLIHLDYAEKLVNAKQNEEAKKVLRNYITIFTGPAYKSGVKKAEFMLEDLNKSSKTSDSEIEIMKLKLELAQTKLELEKLKTKYNVKSSSSITTK